MRLTPSEQDRLQLFLAAELARKRHARGIALNAVEATAIIADTVAEAARDGLRHADAVAAGTAALSRADVLPGVAEIVGNVSVEAVFDDGTRLVVVTAPFGPSPEVHGSELTKLSARAAAALPPGTVLPAPAPELDLASNPRAVQVQVQNRGAVPISVTSHFHFFEVNRRLEFDRRRGYGRHLAIDAGESVRFEPGEARVVTLIPIGGQRTCVGFSGLVDGALDADGALEAALARARAEGFLGCDVGNDAP